MTEPHEPHAPPSDVPPPGAVPPHETAAMHATDRDPPAALDADAVDAPILEAIRVPPNDALHGDALHGDALHGDAPPGDTLHGDAHPGDALHSEMSESGGMVPPAKPPRARRDPLPLLFGIGIVILIGAVVYLWRHPISELIANAAPDEHVVALQQQVAGLQQQLTGLQQRLGGIEQRPVPAPVNLSPLEQRLGTLEQNVTDLEKRPSAAPAAGEPGPMVDAAAREHVAAAREQVSALAAKFEALAKQQGQITAQQTQIASSQSATTAALAARIDADQQRIAAVTAQAGQITAVNGRLDAQDQRVGALATEASKINGVAERAARVARIQAATAALEAGRPLGDLPDAQGPQAAALVRFRSEAPPTEAALRLAFPAAAAAAQSASRPDTAQLPFWQAIQTRAQELVTVRRGDDVVVGDPASGVIARARHMLDAGDLAGTVTVLSELSGKPADAFADWVRRAKALLDARAALAALAARA